MNGPELAARRTVLQTIAATLAGGSVATGAASAAPGTTRSGAHGSGAVETDLEIVASHDHDADEHLFDLDTRELSAGWTTIELDNRTEHTHFAYLAKLPQEAIAAAEAADTALLDFYVEHVTRPFQWFMDDLLPETEPDPDDLSDRYSNLEEGVIFPPWFENVLPSGGVGLTTGETTSTTTVELDPGEYIVECYVKTEDGEFHSYLGMIDQFTVTEERTGSAPEATLDVGLSTAGIDAADTVQPGQHTVAVQFENQQVYDHLLGHDVHLIRFDEETTVEDVNGWTNWMAPKGLVSAGDEPGTFQGGVQTILTPDLLAEDVEQPETAYVHVDLQPGEYAWVSEVPAPADSEMMASFSVPFDEDSAAAADVAGSTRLPTGSMRAMPDPGRSRNFGMASEAEDDDLTERAANSRMHDTTKAAFDRLANLDAEDVR